MDAKRFLVAGLREFTYRVQQITRAGVDVQFEDELKRQAETYLNQPRVVDATYERVALASLELRNAGRFRVFREDIYRRFVADENGAEKDDFGRCGAWIPRGCVVYFDRRDKAYLKIFDDYAAMRGEARFLQDALEKGLYDFLCPNLQYVVFDEEKRLRGYSIAEGELLTRYEFGRYVGGSLRNVILAETTRTGYYFNDLEFHNVIRSGGRLSLIDLESVLPIEWFETDLAFARERLNEIDVGWPIQTKWCSPPWYGAFLRDVRAGSKTG